ncbi:SMC-Scp complex subunit ScpB [Candidatus Pacearchaeota archaeon]|nr:SMC-Scp complex subunit ScpB [Candidatus Pacearchaeota archaeon]
MELRDEGLEELDNERERTASKRVEAALFIAGRFMSLQELVALTDVNPILLKKILADLSDCYKDSGIEIVAKDNLWKMDVASDYTWLVNKLATGSSEFSKAEQETLAILAYKQPMKQSVLIKIRGNKAYEHISKFVQMGLITKKRMGHTAELRLSESFYDYFSVPTGENVAEGAAEEKPIG